jgi:hypothetical protein
VRLDSPRLCGLKEKENVSLKKLLYSDFEAGMRGVLNSSTSGKLEMKKLSSFRLLRRVLFFPPAYRNVRNLFRSHEEIRSIALLDLK